MRSLPTEGIGKRLLRWMRDHYAVSKADVMERFGFEERQARRYINKLERDGAIYPRYRNGSIYYSVRRDHET
tara:strand:+ start:2285 stop:2500 length:216 start_codon:yes stop_codon:yes gene_type:complete